MKRDPFRSFQWVRVATAALALLAGCQNPIPPTNPTPSPSPIASPTASPAPMLNSVEVHIGQQMFNTALLDAIAADGFKIVRIDFDAAAYVSGMSDAAFNWSGYDTFYNEAWKKRGLRPLFIMSYSVIPFNQNLYSDIHAQAAARYPAAWWEGYNEPDGHFRDSNGLPLVSSYIANILPAAKAIRVANPSTHLFTGGLSTIRLDWAQAMVDGGMFPTFDTFATHLYGVQFPTISSQLAQLRKILARQKIPIAVTEFGVPNPTASFVTSYHGVLQANSVFLWTIYESQDDVSGPYGIYDMSMQPKPGILPAIQKANGL